MQSKKLQYKISGSVDKMKKITHQDALNRTVRQTYELEDLKNLDRPLTPEMQKQIIDSVKGYCKDCQSVEDIIPDCIAAQRLLDYLLENTDMKWMMDNYLNIHNNILGCVELCGNENTCGSARIALYKLQLSLQAQIDEATYNEKYPAFELDRFIVLSDIEDPVTDAIDRQAQDLSVPEPAKVIEPWDIGATYTLNISPETLESTYFPDFKDSGVPQETKKIWDPGEGDHHIDSGHPAKNNT